MPLGAPPSDAVGEGVAMARIQGALFGESEPARFERYALLEKLGAGTSGAVYSAWDPRLDRKIAIKVLHGGASAELEQEARALAKLAHPNVVAIHDVGESEEHLFLAMEFVDGGPLTTLDTAALGWRRVVGIYRQAAAGLAAAHDAGIVHRDFKPANALLGRDGRVRVVDFGLARAGVITGGDAGSAVETRAAGTPRYMAPEQHRGEAIDARTDQYCFCAALWEALLGRPPFEADSAHALAKAKEQAPASTGSSGVPARVVRVLRRGLAPLAADRFASMRDLDAALARCVGGRTRAIVGVALVGTALGVGVTLGQADPPCAGADAVPPQWTASTREALGAAFSRTGLPYAQTSGATTDRLLDRWAHAWGEARADACQRHAQGIQSAQGLDLRTQCLDEQRTRFDALLTVLAEADEDVVDRAVDAASKLPSPRACDDVERLRAVHPIPDAERARVAEATEVLVRARTELSAGHFARARELAAPIRAQCEQDQLSHAPTCVEATGVCGRAASEAGEYATAVDLLTQAAIDAQRGRLQEAFGRAAAGLAWDVGQVGGQLEAALTWVALGQAAIDGENAETAELDLLNTEAATLGNLGRWDDAMATHQRRLARIEALHGPDSALAVASYVNMANADKDRGRIADAEARYAKALEIAIPTIGASHPKVLMTRQNRAIMRVEQGRVEDGLRELMEVLQAQRAVLGPTHPTLSSVLVNISIARSKLGDQAGALEVAVEAAHLVEQAYDEPSIQLINPWLAQTQALLLLGRADEAVERSGRAAALAGASFGAQHLTTAYTLRSYGDALRTAGDETKGIAALREAKAAFEGLELDAEVAKTQAILDAEPDTDPSAD